MSFALAGVMSRRGRRSPGDRCPIDRTMQLVGTRSAVLLMREALFGTSRFDDFVARTDLTEAVVAARLRDLVTAGLLVREPYREPGQRTRQAYALTDSGRDLAPVLMALGQWGSKHVPGTRRRRLEHEDCGQQVRVVLECDEHHRVGVEDVVVS
jgi:DNA-binding HxlR family transcriptional regulator